MSKIVVSIIIPTNNREEQLKRLLLSLKKSTYKKTEIIVVNNGKTITQKLSRVIFLQNDKNRGLAFARKKGASYAKGKYILFIDDDNVVESQMIEKLVESLENNPKFLAAGPLTYYLTNKKKIWFAGVKMNLFTTKPSFIRSIKDAKRLKNRYIVSDNLHNCFMLRKEDGEKVGWFDEEVFMSGTEFDLFQKIKKHRQGLLFIDIKAIDYHDVPTFSSSLLRSLGFERPLRAYYFQRNRGLLVKRYGTIIDQVSLFFLFYPFFFMLYSILFLMHRRFDFLKNHIQATKDGYKYLLKGAK